MSIKILSVIGARPQFIKAAPVSKAFRAHGGFIDIIAHTGQHFDDNMSGAFFRDLGIHTPEYDLGISAASHGEMTGKMLIAIEQVIGEVAPDALLVYGDTNSTLAGALAASKLHVPIIHVEAGLRSRNRRMPEEINRVLTDHVSALLLCPNHQSVQNLRDEGITAGVHWVGDVMQDQVLQMAPDAAELAALRTRLGIGPQPYVLATIHRAENTNDLNRFRAILDYVKQAAGAHRIVLPVHPRIKDRLGMLAAALPGSVLLEPLAYFDMQRLISGSECVLTDSGGLQKEAYFHRTPCITLRDETEWLETIDAGWNRLWTVAEYQPHRTIAEYGDGHAAETIAAIIHDALGNKN